MTADHEVHMQRCLQLAGLGAAYAAPNPMVGAILVHDNRIIGEGFHERYGGAHAEVNCITDAEKQFAAKIEDATLYISLEPCAHFGKTPPCTDLIIKKRIKKVVVGCGDPFSEVNGRGIAKLRAAGVEVIENISEAACRELNRRFFCFHEKRRPFVTLKWAQTACGNVAGVNHTVKISGAATDVYMHRLRSETAAIFAGYNTIKIDDPLLSVRHVPGKQPIIVVHNPRGYLTGTEKIFKSSAKIIVFNDARSATDGRIEFIKATEPSAMLAALHQRGIMSVLIEGGPKTHQLFLDAGIWDEAIVINNPALTIDNGLPAAILSSAQTIRHFYIGGDRVVQFRNTKNNLGSATANLAPIEANTPQ